MRKDYKENQAFLAMDKRGQVAIFIIIAIVIVAVVVIFFLLPNSPVSVNIGQETDPASYLRDCIEPEINTVVDVLAKQGGYTNPNNFVLYEGEKIQYLCYTSQNYQTCKVQQPLLVNHIENEIKSYVEPKARDCMNNLIDDYESRGFTVQSTPGEINVDVDTGKISVEFLSPTAITKESTQRFEKFAVGIDSELYDLLMTAVSIIQFESVLGDSETTLYLQYYPDLKIEKIKRDGDTIYKLSNVVTQDSFTFASRSLVWPQGYGLEEA